MLWIWTDQVDGIKTTAIPITKPPNPPPRLAWAQLYIYPKGSPTETKQFDSSQGRPPEVLQVSIIVAGNFLEGLSPRIARQKVARCEPLFRVI